MKNKTREIFTNGLSLVPETPGDARDIYRYMGCDPEITRYTGWNPYTSLEETLKKIERDISAEDGSYSWVIIKKGGSI